MRLRGSAAPTPPEQPVGSRWWDPPGALRGINLRSWLVLQLADASGTVTVADLVERVGVSGLRVDGRPSKTISDALRWEVLRGRAVRLARGRYGLGRLAGATKHRMRGRLRACRARLGSAVASPAGDAAATDDRVGVRAVLDLLASRPVVAQTRNEGVTPASDPAFVADRSPP